MQPQAADRHGPGDGRTVDDVCREISASTHYAWRAATAHGALRALDDHADGHHGDGG
jgi:hypothetical protein